MGFWGSVGNLINPSGDLWSAAQYLTGTGAYDPTTAARAANQQVASGALGLGNQAAGYYGQGQAGLNSSIAALQAQAQGQNSVSAMQLQQGLQQNLAAQQAMAASAAPQNAAAAARTAAIQSGQLGAGLAGQQALAGLQERNQAQQQLGQLQLGQFQTNASAATGGYNAAINANNASIQNPQKTTGQALLGGLGGGSQALSLLGGGGGGGAAGAAMGAGASGAGAGVAAGLMSDRRLKTNVRDGSNDAAKALSGLKAYSYDYKDEKYGKGKQLGVMAQGLEAAGLGHAIIETPAGKAVHGGKLAAALAAMMPGLDDRISKLEDGERRPSLGAALANRVGKSEAGSHRPSLSAGLAARSAVART